MLKIMGTVIGTMLIHNDTSPFWKTLTQPFVQHRGKDTLL